MNELKLQDKVAYVRFASVYLDFKDVHEFLSELQDLLKSGAKPGRDGEAEKVAQANAESCGQAKNARLISHSHRENTRSFGSAALRLRMTPRRFSAACYMR